jgi:transposase/transposase-like protein
MLQVETNHRIILLFFREGHSIREIAKKLKIHRNTVTARIDQYEQFKASPLSDQDKPRSLLNQYLRTGSVYNSSTRGKRKLTEDVVAIIEGCLQENEVKRLDGRMKQRLKKIDIHEKILSAGHTIGYSIVCDYITKITAEAREAFIRQEYAEGSSCEFDWGEIMLRVGGRLRRYYLAVFTSAFSNYRFALIFERQDSLAFKEAHICFFEHVGGVYQQMVYDNMRVAVARFVGRNEKTPTEGLLQLSRWYQFQWRFCNAAKGNEKGHVERSVEYIRRKVFGFKDDFESLVEAQSYLLERLGELNKRSGSDLNESAAAKLEKERKGLCAHRGCMECFVGENHKVDKYSTICCGTNRYSVPDHLIGKMVFVKIYSHQIKIYDADRVLCHHQRLYERFSWQINLNHYLVTLGRKPGALAGSIALKQAPSWLQHMYSNHFTHDSKSFIELLQYCQGNDVTGDQLQASMEKLAHRFSDGITVDHVIALLGNRLEEAPVTCNEPDAIALRSMENLKELASMMNFN